MNLKLANRVAIYATLFFLILSVSPNSNSDLKHPKSETYKDIIEKAYNLSLQRDRQQAINILISALQKENRPTAVAEIRKAIVEISHLFFSDKAQQAYESGLSFKKTDLNQSINKLSEALRIEPDNNSIIEDLSRTMLLKNDCAGAAELVIKYSKLFPFDEELRLIQAQAYVCQSQWPEYDELIGKFEYKKSALAKFWLVLELEKNFKQKNTIKAQDSLTNLRKIDIKYPPVFYWSWKLSHSAKRPNIIDGQKYLVSCKNISANQARQYMIDPMLCRHIQEVEADLKGINGKFEQNN
jgi:tetratricopeptide (TPR) repeat protein